MVQEFAPARVFNCEFDDLVLKPQVTFAMMFQPNWATAMIQY